MIDLTPTCACKKYNSTLPNMSLPCRRVIPTNHAYNQCCLDHWGAASQDIRTWQSTRSVRIYWPVWPVDEHSLLYTSWEVAYIAQVTSGWRIAVPGGGGYSQKNWAGVCGPFPKTLTLFMTKICDFPYHIFGLTKNLIPYLWPDPSDLPYNYLPSSDQC